MNQTPYDAAPPSYPASSAPNYNAPMTTSEGPPPQFAPLPLRARNALETLDVSVKLFKQYWKPMLAWSVIVNLILSIPFLNYVGMVFAPPFMMGVVGCCLAAAVRGQNVGFKQCSAFARPRYWSILAMHVLAGIIAIFVLSCLTGLGIMGVIFAAQPFGNIFNGDSTLGIIVVIVGLLVLLFLWSILLAAAMTWQGLTGVVACMEDETSGSALVRAWRLLGGNWRLGINITLVLGLGMLALWAILGGTAALVFGLGGLRDSFSGFVNDDSSVFGFMAGFLISSWLLGSLYMPIHYSAMTLLYLDLRVRHEALDLEWTAHRQTPNANAANANAPYAAPSFANAGEHTVVPLAVVPAFQPSTEPLNSPFVMNTPPVTQASNEMSETPAANWPHEPSGGAVDFAPQTPFSTSENAPEPSSNAAPTAVFEDESTRSQPAAQTASSNADFSFSGDSIPPRDSSFGNSSFTEAPQPNATPEYTPPQSAPPEEEKRF